MVLKIVAILALIVCGLLLAGPVSAHRSPKRRGLLGQPISFDLLTAVGAAMVPVLVRLRWLANGELCRRRDTRTKKESSAGFDNRRTGVVVLYLAVNFVCLRVLGPAGLAATTTPASDVMRLALGETGARAIAAGIAISTLGFLSQGMLTAPRVYFAMAEDGLFFKAVGRLHPKTHVPIVAIALQGMLAIVIALSGRYEQILNYVVSVDFIFFGLTATCIFVFRRRKENRDVG